MNSILAFFKTTRPINLLIIAITMYAMRFFVEGGFINHATASAEFPKISQVIYRISELRFFFLTLIMMFLAASGNIINDYFDVKVDRINKPERITIDKGLKRRVAMAAHHTLNGIAVVLGFYVGWAEKIWFYSFVPVVIAGALWFYSFYLKKTFLLGNILVALVVSIVPIWATYGTLTQPLIVTHDIEMNSFPISEFYILYAIMILAYSIQAYVITLVREIAKDAEDVKGDKEYGYRTLPIVWGWKRTRISLLAVQCLWFIMLLKITHIIMTEYIPLWGILFGLIVALPFLLSIFCIRKKDIKKSPLYAG